MQSVGEVMAIGRTFCESLQKALRSLEQGRAGLNADPGEAGLDEWMTTTLLAGAPSPPPTASSSCEAALRRGIACRRVVARTGIDPWFVRQIERDRARNEQRHRRRRRARSGRATGGPSAWASPTTSWPTCAGRPTADMRAGAAAP